MKFRIPQGELSKALLAVNKSLMVKANLPILSNVLVSAAKGKLEILSTNLETATKATTPCQAETEGKITLPGRPLFEFVSQLPEGEVVFEKLGEEVVVSTKRYSARFATQSTEDFPAIPKIEKGHSVFVGPQEFMSAVSKIAFCAAVDEGRPVLTGVLCEFGKNNLSMVATDGYRLGFQKVGIDFNKDNTFKIVVPAKSIIEVAKIVSEQAESLGAKGVELVIAESLNQINFKAGGVEYTSRLIEGAFPNWQKLIPTSFASKAKVNKEEFIKIVRVASIFARDSGNIVRFKFEPTGSGGGSLSVYAAHSQIGSNEAQTEIELSGKGGEIAFNFRYLLEMLSSVDSEDVEFEMIESLNPGKLTIPGDHDYFHIIMPVRLQS
jgi:DNA polymerase-3 subunit beta